MADVREGRMFDTDEIREDLVENDDIRRVIIGEIVHADRIMNGLSRDPVRDIR